MIAAVSATINSLSLGAGAQMFIRWVDFNAVGGSGNDDGLAIDDFSVGLAVDNPPQLTSSAPANGASNVPVTTEIDLQFSEAVTVNPTGITLTCGASTVTIDGGGISMVSPLVTITAGKVSLVKAVSEV